MVTKLNQSFYKLLLWISIMVAILSACTAEGCEYCYEEDTITRVISYGYTPSNAEYGDTLTIKVVISDSLKSGFEYYWSAYQDSSEIRNIGEFVTGTQTNDVFIRSNLVKVYNTLINEIRWVANEEAMIDFRIYNRKILGSPISLNLKINLEE